MTKGLNLFLLFSMVACATTHNGSVATSNTPALVVSNKINTQISDDYYLFIEYTFENKSSEWANVSVKDLDMSGQKFEVLVGDKLKSWTEGAELKLKQSEYNTQIFLGSLTAIGTGAALFGKGTTTKNAGLGAAGAGLTASSINRISRSKRSANTGLYSAKEISKSQLLVPDSYLLADFKVAPGSFVRKWVVIKNPPMQAFTLNTFVSVNNYAVDKFTTKY